MAKHSRRGATTSKAVIKRTQRKQISNRYLKPQFTNDAVAKVWNPNKSAKQNLINIGLAHDPNKSVTHGNPCNVQENKKESSKTIAVGGTCELFDIPQSDDLRANDINMRRRALPQLEVDQKYASKCLAKHGTNYKVASFVNTQYCFDISALNLFIHEDIQIGVHFLTFVFIKLLKPCIGYGSRHKNK
jgi:hypothetical protein